MALPPFHNGQKQVYKERKRFNLLLAGRRWRKTTFGSAVLTRYAWLNRGEYLWGSPTHDQNKIALSNIEKILDGKKSVKINRSSMTVELPNGSLIRLRSLHKPDNVRGFTINGVVIDEAAYIHSGAYTEVIRPTLMDTLGWSFMITTPASTNWIYDLHRGGNKPDFSTWRIPSYGVSLSPTGLLTRTPHLYENPELRYDEMVSLLDTMTSISFRQEILCEFLSSGLNPFTNIDEVCILKPRNQYDRATVAGLDLAKTTDYSVLSIIDPVTREEIYLHIFPHENYTDQVDTIIELCKQYNIKYICFDSTGVGSAVAEMIYPALSVLDIGMIPYTFSNSSKVSLINNLILAMEQKSVRFTDSDTGIYEFRRFTRIVSGLTVKFEAETGVHDDTVISRALALHMVSNMGIFH